MTILSNIIIWAGIIFIIYWAVKKHKAKKNGQKYEKQYYPIIIGLMLLIVGSIMSPIKGTKATTESEVSNVSSSVKKKSSSSSYKSVAKKASSEAFTSKSSTTSSSSSSQSSSSSLDYSGVEFGMTMDQVISAIGKQPTDRDDNAIYYDDEEFDFNDNKLIGASVKSVQDKIDKYYKDEEKARKKQQKQQKKQKFVDDINNKIDELNQATQESSGIDIIQGIDHPYTHTYKVHLDSFMLEGNDRQIKSVLNSINSQFIEIFENNGKQIPVMHYDVNGTEIAKNKVMNPSEVKLEN